MNKDLKKVLELGNDFKRAMLTTITEEGKLFSRPMSSQLVDEEGNIWLFSDKGTEKVQEIKNESDVNINYMGKSYVSVYGVAQIVEDDAKKKKLWNKEASLWFGKEEPDESIVLIKIESKSAEYWESEGVKSIVDFVKSIVKKEEPNPGKNEEVEL